MWESMVRNETEVLKLHRSIAKKAPMVFLESAPFFAGYCAQPVPGADVARMARVGRFLRLDSSPNGLGAPSIRC